MSLHFSIRPHHHPVHSSHGRGWHPGWPHRHHFPRQAVLRRLLALPEDPAGHGLLPDPGQERLRPDASVLQEFCQHRFLQQEGREGKREVTENVCFKKKVSHLKRFNKYWTVYSVCLWFRRTVYQRAVQMPVLVANQRVKPPLLVKTVLNWLL